MKTNKTQTVLSKEMKSLRLSPLKTLCILVKTMNTSTIKIGLKRKMIGIKKNSPKRSLLTS